MFKYISINFPDTPGLNPKTVYEATLYQKRYAHEVVVVEFKDWGVEYDVVSTGSPVHMEFASLTERRDFYGYVHHISLDRTPGKHFTTVTFIGGSFPMKQRRQTLYKDVTADQVVSKIADNYHFVARTIPTSRIYPHIAQAGLSDWELMVRLAKQSGYSLRTENTELYFQPVLEDYKNYRSEAHHFVMRNQNHPDGSTIYSFKPLISESMPYEDDETKAAVAVSGVNVLTGEALSVATQVRNKKTRFNQKIEFFDKFDVDTVALTPEVAGFESQSAEDRNSFPYRAVVEVLGTTSLRPDMPVYLGGIGSPYSGFWVILEAEHKIIETQLNTFMYTTMLTVGSDSLGDATTWIDNKTVVVPDKKPARTIIPNVKQTKVKPVTKLATRTKIISPSNKGSFGTLSNRSGQTNARDPKPSTWKSQTKSLDTIVPTVNKPHAVTERLANKRAGR